MPNGQTEYEKWYEALPGWLRGLATPPVPIARVREPTTPTPTEGIAGVAPKAYEVLAGLTPEERARLPYPIAEEPIFGEIARRRKAEVEAAEVDIGVGVKVPPQPTEPPPEGFRWAFDRDLNRWVPQFVGMTAQQQAAQALSQQQLQLQRQQQAQRQAQFEAEMEWEREQARQARLPEPISPYQEQQFGLQEQRFGAEQRQFQQQFGLQQQAQTQQQAQFQAQLQFQQAQAQAAQEEQERRYGAQLAAQPISWLQYAAYTGEEPVTQPWMVPLGFQNVGGAITPQAGQPFPGFQMGEGQQAFAGLPQLRTPSAQLQARWGPTAQAQFLGYRQARTGATPTETQFRLGSGRAPAGAFGGFSRFR